MYSYKILLKISGSIAAYKSAYLVSKLVQQGYEVQVVATPSALKFIGPATFEGLTGRPLLTEGFEEGKMMSHIHLAKWADLTLLAPATANTLNKMAAGIADNLVTSLFLAHDRSKPYLAAPAMNSAMLEHPATQKSIAKLKSWGVNVLETASGRLACGDEGYGKMPEPDVILNHINKILHKSPETVLTPGRLLITFGGTSEKIDQVRELSNISTGRTGAIIAGHFLTKNWEVTCLHADQAILPETECRRIPFSGFESLNNSLKNILNEEKFSCIIHLAAVSDYSPVSALTPDKEFTIPVEGKLDSRHEEVVLKLKKNPKILNQIKAYAKKGNPLLVAFKLTSGETEKMVREKISGMKIDSGADLVIWNDIADRISGKQTRYFIFSSAEESPYCCPETNILARKLEELLSEKIKTV